MTKVSAIGVVCLVLSACSKDKAAAHDPPPVATQTAAATTPASAPSASAAPTASAPARKPPSAKQPKPSGCADGWTRNTKGVCVDWCETDGDCDEGSTCQDSDSIDPDLGKIKTCQKPKHATATGGGAPCPYPGSEKDHIACPSENCPTAFAKVSSVSENGTGCVRICKSMADCGEPGSDCVQMPNFSICQVSRH